MERMSYPTYSDLELEIQQLEEENKNLKEYNGELIENHKKDIAILCEENKKLKSDLEECECSMHFENDEVGYRKRECKKLKEEIRFLEQCLDNKEKVNKSLREELGWYKTEHERLVDKLVIKGATELLDREFENKKGWQGE